jgi:hypothetical protein
MSSQLFFHDFHPARVYYHHRKAAFARRSTSPAVPDAVQNGMPAALREAGSHPALAFGSATVGGLEKGTTHSADTRVVRRT